MPIREKLAATRKALFGDSARAFGTSGVLLLALLAIVPYRDHFREWYRYQRTYLRLIRGRDDALTLQRRFQGGVHQTWIPELGVVDRCASCHVAQITSTSETEPIRILGTTSHFDVEAFFGSILAATFRSSDPENMKRLLGIYLNAEPKAFDAAWRNRQDKIVAKIKDDPFGAKDVERTTRWSLGDPSSILGWDIEGRFAAPAIGQEVRDVRIIRRGVEMARVHVDFAKLD